MLRNNKKIVALLCAVVMTSSIFIGCSSNNEAKKDGNNAAQEQKQENKKEEDKKETAKEYINKDYIVDADWLKENIDNKDVVIVDCRESKDYKKGHIKNAINIVWKDLSNDENNVLDAEALSKKLSEFGLAKDKTIVLYGVKGSWGEDGRVQWTLRYAGLENAKMLNGGFDLWQSKEYETSKEEVKPTAAEVKVDSFKEDLNITTEHLKENLGKVKIIDTREKDEYEGATKYGEARGGHLPGAININFSTLYNEDGTLKSQDEIEKIMTDNGINKEDEIVTYCTSGIRSGHMAMVLRLAGYNNAKNYDASYVAWAGTPDLEVEK
ncbi:sulfurtransferase [Clostridium sp. CTA-19]